MKFYELSLRGGRKADAAIQNPGLWIASLSMIARNDDNFLKGELYD
jgi:hypothetical protein